MDICNGICLWIVIGIMAAAGIHRLKRLREGSVERKEEVSGRLLDSPRFLRMTLLLVLYGLVAIRSIGFGSIPGGFNQDGAMGAVDALALATYGTDRFGNWLPAHFQAWGYGQMSVLLSYMSVPFIKLWGLNSVTARLPMLLASVAGAGALYGLVKDIFGSRAGVVTLVCVAIAPWHFMQSRWALDCNMFPHMFILGLFFLNRGLKKAGICMCPWRFLPCACTPMGWPFTWCLCSCWPPVSCCLPGERSPGDRRCWRRQCILVFPGRSMGRC